MSTKLGLTALFLLVLGSSCDAPSAPDPSTRLVVLSGGRIVAKVGQWFNLQSSLGKQILEAEIEAASLVGRFPELWDFSCASAGTGSAKIKFADGTASSYSILCVDKVTLTLNSSLNVDQHFGLDVSWVVQSDGLIEITQENGDHIIKCIVEGSGTLWVAYRPLGNDYYDLECIRHAQGSGAGGL